MSKIEKGKEKEKAEKLMTNVDFALDLMLGIERLAKDLTNKYDNLSFRLYILDPQHIHNLPLYP